MQEFNKLYLNPAYTEPNVEWKFREKVKFFAKMVDKPVDAYGTRLKVNKANKYLENIISKESYKSANY